MTPHPADRTTPPAHGRTRRARGRCAGLTLVELLISLLLMSILLTAIAVATHASLAAYRVNSDSAALTQTSRLLMMRMAREVRTADAVDYTAGTGNLVIYPPAGGSVQRVQYSYSSSAKTLTYTQTTTDGSTSQTLLSNTTPVKMTYFYINYDTVTPPNPPGGTIYTERVTVTMDFQVGGQTTRMVCSAAPRRNLEY